eukprot:6160319-Lingulodinium_polyedra.AAC.1
MRYHTRMRVLARALRAKLGEARALDIIRRKDVKERTVWVDRQANSNLTLGQIIHQVARERDHAWEDETRSDKRQGVGSPSSTRNPNPGNAPQVAHPRPKVKQEPADSRKEANGLKHPANIAQKTKDGRSFCAAYGKGKCTNPHKSCPNGLHTRAAIRKDGEPCGAYHPWSQCRNNQVPRQQ